MANSYVTKVMLPKEWAAGFQSWELQTVASLGQQSWSTLQGPSLPRNTNLACHPALVEAAVGPLSLGKVTVESTRPCLVCVHVCARVRGRTRASLLYPSYLLHLSYDFHLELNKLQSGLFSQISGVFSKWGSGR